MAAVVRIAMLNADVPVPNVAARCGPTYGRIFHHLLVAAGKRISPEASIRSTDFNVVLGEYPASLADDFDAVLITGSAASAYDDASWIHRLDQFIARTYRDAPQVRIFGSCFGHQIVCQSLLREHGATIEKDPHGWELGVHEIQLTDDFAKAFGAKTSRPLYKFDRLPTPEGEDGAGEPPKTLQTMRLQFVHADHVKLRDGSLPPSWIAMGRSKHCALQGVLQPGRVLTYQGHFEFSSFINSETVKVFGKDWDPAVLQASLDAIDKEDDAAIGADMVVRFLLE